VPWMILFWGRCRQLVVYQIAKRKGVRANAGKLSFKVLKR
jgi:hypothetical protein